MSETPLPRGVRLVDSDFWNIRGSYKVRGLLEIGTQMSLVRCANGKYVLLDACAMSPEVRQWVDEKTNDGEDIAAVLHLHPFHTMHVVALHRTYGHAKLYGTARHLERQSELPWQQQRTEDPELHQEFAADFDFSVPRGVHFIPADQNLHFASVLAFHRASKTLHVDDTLLHFRMPPLVRAFKRDVTSFHPTLSKVLEPRAGAVAEFRAWAAELIQRCHSVENLCAAHAAVLLGRDNSGDSISERVVAALQKVEGKLEAHAQEFG